MTLPVRTRPRHLDGGPLSGQGLRSARRPFSALRRAGNGMKTAVLLAGLGGLLVLLGAQFGQVGAAVGLLLGLAVVGGSYWYSDRLALMAARAVPVGPDDFPIYHRIVRELTAEAGLPMPRLYVTPDAQPNAFATGRNPRHAAVAVTRGLLDLLDARELRAVLAHELAHVGNRDILITSVAAALATGISFLANLVGMLPFFGSSEDDEDPGLLATLVAVLIAPIAAALLQLALSRSREFEADRTGAQLIGDGSALASALAKIDRVARQVPMRVEPTQASKYLVHPLTGRGAWTTLFMTHPPVEKRIARLIDLR
ncbi:protease HtpX [Blastococcus sp. CT_GayMR20]|nr:protease HtpX [Blastococcus sp. CT_GayMR20]